MRTYTQLTQEQRYQIQALLKMGHQQTEIAESNMDAKTSRLTKDQSTDFLFISLSSFTFEYGFDTLVGIYFFEYANRLAS